jgi:SP family sugar:H+ symporter-like MFS transporter
MAASLMTQWLFNFVIAKITPIMLADITYGTFLLFGSLCIVMGIWTVFCVPETKGVPLESIGELFEGSIIKGCIMDTFPKTSRAKRLQHHHNTHDADADSINGDGPRKGARVNHIEQA